MATGTTIEWTDATWNPVTGCSKISPGCKHCYAERMALRLQAMGQPRYADGFGVTLQHDLLTLPLTWNKPRRVFVNSMSDLFHDDVPSAFILRVFETMVAAPQHSFQILTKRPERVAEMAPTLPWPPNVWMGTSIERSDYTWRARFLKLAPASVRFLSIEPLLGPIPRLPLAGIDWVIVGGESGHGARPMHPDWVRSIRNQCVTRGVQFFFKQWGGPNKKATGRHLDGDLWNEMPIPRPSRHHSHELAARPSPHAVVGALEPRKSGGLAGGGWAKGW